MKFVNIFHHSIRFLIQNEELTMQAEKLKSMMSSGSPYLYIITLAPQLFRTEQRKVKRVHDIQPPPAHNNTTRELSLQPV